MDELLGHMLPVQADGWRDRAACLGMPLDMFFTESKDPRASDPALRVCAGCPVQEECLDEVLWDPSAPGVFGGTTREDRRQIRRQLRRSAA